MRVLFALQTFSETFLITRKVDRESIKIIHKSSCQRTALPVWFKRNLDFPDRISKNMQVKNFTKFRPCVKMDGYDVASSSFCNLTHLIRRLFCPFLAKHKSVSNRSRIFGGNSPVSSRSKPGGQQAKEWNRHNLFQIAHNGKRIKKLNQSHYIPYVPRGCQEGKVPSFRENGTGWRQVVSLTHRPPFTPRKYCMYSFLLEANRIKQRKYGLKGKENIIWKLHIFLFL